MTAGAPRRHAHLAPPGLRDELAAEAAARGVTGAWHGELLVVDGPPVELAWAAERFDAAEELPVASIGDAARQLRARQRSWVHLSLAHHRRGELVAEKLPPFRARPLRFGERVPEAPLGHFGLLAPDRMLVLPRGRTGVPRGEFTFVEDHVGPPSRAYLKLWEAFTRLGTRPAPGERCLDLGASPGGWSWALLELGARVLAVDKAPLDARLLGHPRLEVLQASAFAPLEEAAGTGRDGLDERDRPGGQTARDPEDAPPPQAARGERQGQAAPGEREGRAAPEERAAPDPAWLAPDWLFSDVICYPERLLRLLESWLARPDPPRMVATLKFQGAVDPGVVEAFRALPGGRLLHLSANKHELTFARVGAG